MRHLILPLLALAALAACAPLSPSSSIRYPSVVTVPAPEPATGLSAAQRRELAMQALNLLDIGYRFGGKNPEAGLDCSGLVSVVYKRALGWNLPYNAAQLAMRSDPVTPDALEPGDLVFFNTRGTPRSHVGIYLGRQQFIHAPRTNSSVRVANLKAPYFAKRFEGGRRLRPPGTQS